MPASEAGSWKVRWDRYVTDHRWVGDLAVVATVATAWFTWKMWGLPFAVVTFGMLLAALVGLVVTGRSERKLVGAASSALVLTAFVIIAIAMR